MGERRGGFTKAEKDKLAQEMYEGVVKLLAERTPDSLQKTEEVEAQMLAMAGDLEKRINMIELQQGSTLPGSAKVSEALGALCQAVRTDDTVYRRLMSEAKRYPNTLSRYLVAIVEAMRG